MEAIFIVIGVLLGYFGGRDVMKDVIQDEAVKSGHAEYYLDDKNERQWRWK